MTVKMVDLHGFAELAGVKYSTMRKYHQRSTQRRREAVEDKSVQVADWMLPEPTATIGQSPAWSMAAAKKWIASRPRANARTPKEQAPHDE